MTLNHAPSDQNLLDSKNISMSSKTIVYEVSIYEHCAVAFNKK